MSPDPRLELEQLDGLAAQLASAGRIARAATASRERPDPAFAARLRVQLVGEAAPASGYAAAASATATAVPPSGPLDAEEPLFDRRRAGRPFANAQIAAPAEVPAGPAGAAADRNGQVAVLRPSVRWRLPTRVARARWIAVGLAASVALASFLYGATLLWPARPNATAEVAVSATLLRDGASSPLVQGAELHEGDRIAVAAGGQATIAMGGSFLRMAPGSQVRLDSLTPDRLAVEQLAGRAYHRASVPAGGSYSVVTASVTWTAGATAFDLDRHATAFGGEEVRGLALFDGLDLAGPSLREVLSQGQRAVVQLTAGGSPAGSPLVDSFGSTISGDAWLVSNAQLDRMSGLDLGDLAVVLGSPTPKPSQPAATAEPTTGPVGHTPAPAPTKAPTPPPPPQPTPTPTPAGPANLGKLNVAHNGDGTYTFSWPKYTGDGFQFYKLVYGPAGTQPTFNGSNYWACNDVVTETSWSGGIDPGNYAVRLQVVDESSGSIVIRAQTNSITLKVAAPTPTLPATQNLGALTVSDDGGGKYTFSWAPYTGGWDFDAYKLVYVPWDGIPSYTTGSPYWAAVSPGSTITGSIGIPTGDWSVRIQAIGWPFGGEAYVFGQTSVFHLTVP
jgi:hypothetical protein